MLMSFWTMSSIIDLQFQKYLTRENSIALLFTQTQKVQAVHTETQKVQNPVFYTNTKSPGS